MMRFRFSLLCMAIVAMALVDATHAAPIRVMSFNIRYGTAADGANHWDQRHDLVVEAIRDFDPDLLGTQEVLAFQAEFLREQLPEYDFVGVGRDDGKLGGEMAAIFFRRDRFEKIDEGHFWLSETPDVPGSVSWDSSLTRMASWVRLRDLRPGDADDAREIVFVNTHFDHRGEQARLESARLIRTVALELATGSPLVITGDFNAPALPESGQPIAALLGTGVNRLFDTYRVVHPEPSPDEGTFGAFTGERDGPRIDWIIVSREFAVRQAEINHMQRNGRYPSDHFPVTAVISLD